MRESEFETVSGPLFGKTDTPNTRAKYVGELSERRALFLLDWSAAVAAAEFRKAQLIARGINNLEGEIEGLRADGR